MGLESALIPGDELITAYRCHGYTHARGVSIKEIMAELAGEPARERDRGREREGERERERERERGGERFTTL